jgi:(p)ppGpp synthase/HD superfamily hydrolase
MATRLTPRYASALQYAIDAHGDQTRKASDVTYLTHLLAVSSLVLEFGGSEDEAIAALLHDVVEDCGTVHAAQVRARFGDAVADIVLACTDASQEERANAHTPAERRAQWQRHKQAYVEAIAHKAPPALLVSCCDKLHNAWSIVLHADAGLGRNVFDRFTASADETLWYYRALSERFLTQQTPPAQEFSRVVRRMHEMAAAPAPAT